MTAQVMAKTEFFQMQAKIIVGFKDRSSTWLALKAVE